VGALLDISLIPEGWERTQDACAGVIEVSVESRVFESVEGVEKKDQKMWLRKFHFPKGETDKLEVFLGPDPVSSTLYG
jgi:hypothetical protein